MTRKRTSDNELAMSSTGSAPAPARRKAAPRTRTQRSAAPVESALTSAAEPVAQEMVAATVVYEPTYEQIAQLAYLYWEARGCQGGSPEEDWLRAETELRVRAQAA